MLAALLPILVPLLSGGSLATIAAGVSGAQWLALGEAVLSGLPSEVDALASLGPLFEQLVSDVRVAGEAGAAVLSARGWVANNAASAVAAQAARDAQER